MDPASLSFAVLTAFKEVYLISKFVCNTLSSVKNYKTEQRDLAEEFFLEFSYTRSFGRLFLQGIGNNEGGQNTQWLGFLSIVLEKQRLLFGDYTKLATELDADYRTYSPILNEQFADTKLIEFSLDQNIPAPPSAANSKGWFAKVSNLPVRGSFKGPIFQKDSWKWTLWQRRKLDALLEKYQKHNARLKDVVPFLVPQHVTNAKEGSHHAALDEDAVVTGLKPHLALRELIERPDVDHIDLRIPDLGLNAPARASSLAVAEFPATNNFSKKPQKMLVEYKYYVHDQDPTENVPQAGSEQSIHQLAGLLASSGKSNLRTLPFKGYLHQAEDGRYAFLFNFPAGTDESQPISLLDLLEQKSPSDRLNLPDRFVVAQIITKTIATFHADGWVHKSLRSQSIKFFHKDGMLQRHSPYLADFEYSRPESAETNLTFDTNEERNIYRHPDRQGPPSVRFNRLHDLYALGVILLEIGLWRTAGSIYVDICTKTRKARPGGVTDPKMCREVYLDIARKKLPHTMGPAFTRAVVKCLLGDFESMSMQGGEFKQAFYDTVIENLDIKRLVTGSDAN